VKNETGEVDRLMSVSIEITDRVLARRALDVEKSKLQTVFRQAPFPIGVFEGPEHRIVFANDQWQALVGRPLPVGERLRDAIPELTAQNILTLHDRAYAGEAVGLEEVPLQLTVGAQARTHYFHVALQPLVSETGAIDGHVTMALDVTEQVLSRTEIESARRAAETANRAKDEFLAMLGHELRNPLAPIQTALNLMDLRGVSKAERELSVITRQVQHLTPLVDDLLDVSRITSGKVSLTKQPIELSEVVTRAPEMASPLSGPSVHAGR
jgi:signal transduction histidine kinase